MAFPCFHQSLMHLGCISLTCACCCAAENAGQQRALSLLGLPGAVANPTPIAWALLSQTSVGLLQLACVAVQLEVLASSVRSYFRDFLALNERLQLAKRRAAAAKEGVSLATC